MSESTYLHLNIHDVRMMVVGNNYVNSLLSRDFSYFVEKQSEPSETYFSIMLNHEISIDKRYFKKVLIPFKKNARIFSDGYKRLVEYADGSVMLIDRQSKRIQLASLNDDRLREMAYLAILSVSGKELELTQKIFKIHALGVSKNRNLIMMMGPGGGKSTLLLSLMSQYQVELISDDTPLVTDEGKTELFPLKMSVKNLDEIPAPFVANLYPFKRNSYGIHHALDLTLFKKAEEQSLKMKKNVLVYAKRGKKPTSIHRCSKLKMMGALVYHFIIGVGVPFIVEIYWDHSVRGYLDLMRIFRDRLLASIKLLRNAETYTVNLGEERSINAEMIYNILSKD